MAKKTKKTEPAKPVKKTSRKAKAMQTASKTSQKAKARQTAPKVFRISGHVINDAIQLGDLSVEVRAYHDGGPSNQPQIGNMATTVGKAGTFQIQATEPPPIPSEPNVFFTVHRQGKLATILKLSHQGVPDEDMILRNARSPLTEIVIEVDLPGESFTFIGKLVDDLTSSPLAGHTVLAKLTDTDPDTDLGSETTDSDGQFTFVYTTTSATAPPPIEFHLDLTIRDSQGREVSVPNVAVKDNVPFEVRVTFPAPPPAVVVPHLVFGHLLNLANGAPLALHKVYGLDRGADLGYHITTNGDEDEHPSISGAGYFTFIYTTDSATPPPEHVLNLRVEDPNDQKLFEGEVTFKQNELLELRVNVPEPPQPPSPSLDDVFTTLPSPPQNLLPFLKGKNITTIADVRRRGGVRHLAGIPGGADHPAVVALDSHASLSAVSSDVQLNTALINKGYNSVADIANAPRTNFVGDAFQMAGQITDQVVGEFNFARIQVESQAQTLFANTVAMTVMTNSANGFPSPMDDLVIPDLPPPKCACKDCESALSPRAYLAYLLDYSLRHVKNGTAKIDLLFLHNNFFQPFGELPASCAAVDKQVRQVRLCIEVLRRYLGTLPTPVPRTELEKAEKDYRIAAYTMLLNKIGTSYDEIRLARTATPEERAALAERLGIDLGTGTPDRLTELFLAAPDGITYQKLEDLFGLLAPLPGSLTKEPQQNFLKWRLEHLRSLWFKADFDTNPLSDGRPLIDPDLINTGDLKNPAPGNAAFDLWQPRLGLVRMKRDDLDAIRRRPATDDLARLNAVLEEAYKPMTVTAAFLKDLDAKRKSGEDIAADLEKLRLGLDAFSYLLHFIDLIASGPSLLESEWENVISILVQAQKRALFEAWRGEEEDEVITLGPDYFQFPPIDFTEFPPPPSIELPPWRASLEARNEWQDILRSRIDQEKTVIEAMKEAVSSTEEVALPALRDALIKEVPKGVGLSVLAKWVTDNFLIDAQAGGCQQTTHIAQAIETIQGLLFSLHTNQLRDTYPTLTLDADLFEEEWRWIGSYATWRAAMAVYLYPENILLPSLRLHQTPAFINLVKTLRNNSRLTPEQACVAARAYSDYFQDVGALRVEATCQTLTRIYRGDCRREKPASYRSLFYMFARPGEKRAYPSDVVVTTSLPQTYNITPSAQLPQSNVSVKVYWSAYDPKSGDPNYAQTFWDVVQGLENVTSIVGAVAHTEAPDRRFIYLFATTQEGDQQKLVLSKYNLENQIWAGKPEEIELPPDKDQTQTGFTAVLKQTDDESSPVQLAIRLPNGAIWTRQVDRDKDWKLLVGSFVGKRFGKLNAMIEIKHDKFDTKLDEFYLIALGQAGPFNVRGQAEPYAAKLFYRLFGPKDDGEWRPFNNRNLAEFRGAFTWPETDQAYVFWKPPFSTVFYQVINRSTEIKRDRGRVGFRALNDDWLYPVAGVSLSEIKITDTTDENLREMDFLTFFTLSAGDYRFPEHWADKVKARIAYIDTGLIREVSESGRNWKLADEMVRQFAGISLKEALEQIAKATNNEELTIRFNDRKNANEELSSRSTTSIDIELVAPSSGSDPSMADKMCATQRSGDRVGSFRTTFTRSGDTLDKETIARVGPQVIYPFAINESSAEQNASRRYYIRKSFDDNAKEPRSNRTYLEEAYYFVPIQLALQLQSRGQYPAALNWFRTVYDYSLPVNERIIFHGLQQEGSLKKVFERMDELMRDNLNPHGIAVTRANAYTRYTLLMLVRCFLDFADSEFTRDTAESVSRARILYLTALELLDVPDLKQQPSKCEDLLKGFRIDVGDPQFRSGWTRIYNDVAKITDSNSLATVTSNIRSVMMNGNISLPERLATARNIVNDALASQSATVSFATVLAGQAQTRGRVHLSLQAQPEIFQMTGRVGSLAGQDFLVSTSLVTGKSAAQLPTASLPWLREPRKTTINPGDLITVGFAQSPNGQITINPSSLPAGAIGAAHSQTLTASGGAPPYTFSLSAGTLPAGLTLSPSGILSGTPTQAGTFNFTVRATDDSAVQGTRVYTLTINQSVAMITFDPGANTRAGRQGQVWAALPMDGVFNVGDLTPTFTPNPSFFFCPPINPIPKALRLHAELNLYKLRNCRNIAGTVRQLEPYSAPTDTVSGLPTIGDAGALILPGAVTLRPTQYRYATLIERAKQLVGLAQQLEASLLATLEKRDAAFFNLLQAQQDVSLTQAGVRLQDLRVREAESGVTLAELQQERAQKQVNHYQSLLDEGLIVLEQLGLLALGFAAAGKIFSSGPIAAAPEIASFLLTWASFERREQEWKFQMDIALQDVLIGRQQVIIAEAHVRVVGQERRIAGMQAEHAQEIAEFLANKFTNAELYDWMGRILESVYSFFLQQATATAQLAANQLAFERQEPPPPFIQADYWEAPTDIAAAGNAPDRRGLTGSARLLQDIFQLDQHAFETNQRKLQLTKTISLARLGPAEFQRFRQTGVMPFDTTMEMFDRDFPGHYLRLIKRVRTSVIALIPPIQGIRATLSTTGPARVVIGGDLFQTVTMRRAPELVALTSPRDATGLFDLDQQPEVLLPFEGLGVDASWEFRMPKAANLFDYNTIADVLITIEYTALDDPDYRQQVIRNLNAKAILSAERPFSFRNEFPDQWFDLNNPDQAAPPQMTVKFKTAREDFPPNLEDLDIQEVTLFFSTAPGKSFKVTVNLQFTKQNSTDPFGGTSGESIDGVISTRRGNAGEWTEIIDGRKTPVGEWELALPNTDDMKKRFTDEEIEDILFVITYSGRTPEWPV